MGTDSPKMPSSESASGFQFYSSGVEHHYLILSQNISYYLASLQTKTLRRYHPIFFSQISWGSVEPTIPSSGGSTVVTDLPNSVENLVLQVSCSWLGAAVATAKDGSK